MPAEPIWVPRPALEGNVWPAVPDAQAGRLLSLLAQFEDTQWWPAGQVREYQRRQLETLLAHARRTVPFYRDRLPDARPRPGGTIAPEEWLDVPLLTRTALQSSAEALQSREVPESHGGRYTTRTSGATGEPVTVTGTGLSGLFWSALTLRDHRWHRRNLMGKLCSIRANVPAAARQPPGIELPDWGPPTALVYPTGPAALLGLNADIGAQTAWLRRHDPEYLLTYPNNLRALAARFAADGAELPKLLEIRTVGETVTDETRAECRRVFGTGIVDVYSSEEVGCIALQCPEGGGYHVQSEAVLVEVLDDNGRPCPPGAVGRVVVTALHNFAMPLIRYELRDRAEVGPGCGCGRGLPHLRRILGRSRNMLVLPNGDRRWPLTGFRHFRDIAPIVQFQFEQQSRSRIEARIVAERTLSAPERERFTRVVQEALGHPFEIAIREVAAIERAPNGKFEDFICRIADAPAAAPET